MKLKVANGGAELAVSDENFAREFNSALVFQVVNAYLAAGRSGTASRSAAASAISSSLRPPLHVTPPILPGATWPDPAPQ